MTEYKIITRKYDSNYITNIFESNSDISLAPSDPRKQSSIYLEASNFQEKILKRFPSLNSIETRMNIEDEF